MPETVTLRVNGTAVIVPAGSMVSAAVARAGDGTFRRSTSGEPRGPLCGMGICFECRVTVDGREHSRSCQIPCEPGMEVEWDRPPGLSSDSPAGRPATAIHYYDVVVVGAGPAGLAAARRASECGASVALVDDNPNPGGQIWRSAGKPASDAAPWITSGLTPIWRARIFAAPAQGRIALETQDDEWELAYGSLVLATGARERFLPFPGWTLPNVMGAGGLQALAKSGLPVAGKKVVVAGSGPLLLAVAKYLREHGAGVRAIAEQVDRSALLRFGLALARDPGKLIQAFRLKVALLGIPYRAACWPVAAHGSGKLERVTLRQDGRTWDESCDYLACGFGLIPNVELAALLGCRISGGSVDTDDYQETSLPGIYCAGEAAGIGGLELSLVEGEIAGYAAAGRPERAETRFAARERYRRFAAALERTFALREELKSLVQDDTLVCRCEDVSYGRIRNCSGWRDAKLQTRCGMGPCQGRVCGGAVEFLLGWRAESVRPPLFPARIESLARTGAGADLPP